MEKLVVVGVKPGQIITYQKFSLNPEAKDMNSRMEYEIQVNGKNYAYGFIFNNYEIVEEWLYEIKKTNQQMIFERDINSDVVYNIEPLLKKNPSDEDKQFLNFIVKGTSSNQ